ncbi:MAG: 5-formyltetrahydrofolate cyclo-ligase [Patescibacteria group bacterium]
MKKILRQSILKKRTGQKADLKKTKDTAIRKRITSNTDFQKSRIIFCYVSKKDEVDTLEILKKWIGKKEFIVPRVVDENHFDLHHLEKIEQLSPGVFGVLEPHRESRKRAAHEIELAIIPGVVFDTRGHRIGFGKGYFDRFLKKLKCPKIGLAYEFQIVDKIPESTYDVPVDFIITEKRVIVAASANK